MHCEGAEGTSVNMAAVTLPVQGGSCRGIDLRPEAAGQEHPCPRLARVTQTYVSSCLLALVTWAGVTETSRGPEKEHRFASAPGLVGAQGPTGAPK